MIAIRAWAIQEFIGEDILVFAKMGCLAKNISMMIHLIPGEHVDTG